MNLSVSSTRLSLVVKNQVAGVKDIAVSVAAKAMVALDPSSLGTYQILPFSF
jgi:hypothetical protein